MAKKRLSEGVEEDRIACHEAVQDNLSLSLCGSLLGPTQHTHTHGLLLFYRGVGQSLLRKGDNFQGRWIFGGTYLCAVQTGLVFVLAVLVGTVISAILLSEGDP